ncbi:MAG: HEAT repeat domain-containing protein, partial [Phycisphaerae bacterium]|nr:HEAT repeat domain-containing protein [Phycisphaerae bacterium]
MSTRRLHLVVLALVIVCQSPVITRLGPDGIALGAKELATTTELDPQLKLAKDALLDKASSDQMRINAAAVLLVSETSLARETLLDALKQIENDAVRNAVCKALIQAGAGKGTLDDVDDFIEPVLGVLAADNSATGRLAAEATLIFDYEQISEPLEKLINDASVPLKGRLIAIYALELHPDMRAAITLLELVESPEGELAEDAKRALLALGIPAGDDARDRKQIIEALIAEGPTAFLQKRLIRKESLIRSAKAELALWQGRYLLALGNVYTSISDDAEKAKFLAGHLGGSETIVRLWTLDKIRQDRVGTRPNPKLPAEVGPILVSLVSDEDRDVRLRTARVLSFMTEVNSAQQLLAQLNDEQDDQVKIELFSALGRACYIAFLPNSKIKIAPEIRKQALVWAETYLLDPEPAKAQKGAEVLRMLLEQDGLTGSEADKYFGLLGRKYSALKNESDGPLRGELLSAMATLCAPQSVHKAQSRKRFGRLFESALSDKTDFVREAAVDGLIYIDKTAAL